MSSVIPLGLINSIIDGFPKLNNVNTNTLSIVFGFILTVLLLYLIGITLTFFGKKFFDKIEKNIFYNIPIFNSIYRTIKQIIESVSSPTKKSFQKVVMVEFPRRGIWTLGFVTGESKNSNNKEYYHIIVPTTPNPTSAYLLFIAKDEVKETDISIDEGIKTIISGGVLASDRNYI
tara:strand:- start:125 stop:649 length:525 start_codon:yes stop_codon:yes gene_type:complete